MDVYNITLPTRDLAYGHKTVGTDAVKLTAYDRPMQKGIQLRAPGASDPVPNTKPVWVGCQGVTADSNEGTGGFPIAPGERVTLLCENANELWVVSTIAGQDVAWVAI